MWQVLFGLVGVMVAGAACAETYSFTAVTTDGGHYQTLVNCTGPKTNTERVPKGCILSEPSTAYPNSTWNGKEHDGFLCSAGYPIVFHPTGTLAECVLDAQQPEDIRDWARHVDGGVPCKGHVRFDKNGRAEC